MIRKKLEKAVAEGLVAVGGAGIQFSVEYPASLSHGDYMTNAALVAGKALGQEPKEVAAALIEKIQKLPEVQSAEIAGPGFINITLTPSFIASQLESAVKDDSFGKTTHFSGQKIVVEYTDPNPFKEFHIGHLMTNAIGESIARLYEWSGGEVKRANYQGDVGLHVACAVWGMEELLSEMPSEDASLKEKVAFLGKAYPKGALAYKEDDVAQKEIREINKAIFNRSDEHINGLYDTGRAWSLAYFETVYKRLGTKFDFYFFESEAAPQGVRIVRENVNTVFKESDGAIVYHGEEHGLHTRVFINKEGLPTYEAKELALASMKFAQFPYDQSVVVTANEIKEYFKVLLSALSHITPELAEKTVHIGHGLLKLPSGKMSSRTGDVVVAESLIGQIREVLEPKLKGKEMTPSECDAALDAIAIGAIKFAILRQALGRDIIFDFDKSLSFEGDSGPYLQYTALRAQSVVAKAKGKSLEPQVIDTSKTTDIERYLARFPEVLERAALLRAPQLVVTYLLETASLFNTYYATTPIIGDDVHAPHRVAIAVATNHVLKNGLSVLGIRLPSVM